MNDANDQDEIPVYGERFVQIDIPKHPEFEDRPIMWLTPGDEWWFRRTTVSRIINLPEGGNAKVRYSVLAVRHQDKDAHPGGFDWTMWTEVEVPNVDKESATVNFNVDVPPSFVDTEEGLNTCIKIIQVVLESNHPGIRWVTQYDHSQREQKNAMITAQIGRKKKAPLALPTVVAEA